MREQLLHYQDNDVDLEGFVAFPEKKMAPLVLLYHAWKGRAQKKPPVEDFFAARRRGPHPHRG